MHPSDPGIPRVSIKNKRLMEQLEFDDNLLDERLTQGKVDSTEIQAAVLRILEAVGEDPGRDGLKRTPERVARMYAELLAGYTTDPVVVLNDAIFEVKYDEMVIVRDIEFYSLCEHHLLPFMGRVHVAYIPDGKVLGLSKIPRMVDIFARRLQVQERMTRQIADLIRDLLHPQGVGVVVESLHLCMMMRGVQKHNARMTTSAMHGAFRANLATRQEFLENIGRGASPLQI
jgi:GTP cyclohydrolase IA